MAKSEKIPHQAEYARQEKTLKALPPGFKYPLFNGWQAIQSQRKSGYKTTARAAREIVDNAIEAGAKNVRVIFDIVDEASRKSHQRKNTVRAIAFIDDGPGMVHHDDDRSMLRYALSWGGGSHFDDPNFIGKFGFGLPNSSVNQTQFTEVFTKTTSDKTWNVAVLDIRRDAVPASGEVRASKVKQQPLPEFVVEFLKTKKIDLATGTVVVWHNPDRLTVSQRATLREHMEHDFQVVYRGLIDRVNIYVDSDKPIFKVDPLFLDSKGWLYKEEKAGGARALYDETLMVKHFYDADSGQPHMELIGPEKGKDPTTGFTYDVSLEEVKKQQSSPPSGQRDIGISTIRVRASYLPYPDFIRQERKKVETDEGRRFEVRKRSRGISFVRSGREIDTQDVFPKDNRAEKGVWPLLQSYAYYWGLEVEFDSGVDDCMGIGHDKQTVEPIEDFWRVLHQATVDTVLTKAGNMRRDAGKDETQKKKDAENVDEPSVEAANQAAKMERPVTPGSAKTKKQQEEAEGEAAKRDEAPVGAPESSSSTSNDVEDETGTGTSEQESHSNSSSRGARFAIEFFESEGGVFMEPRAGVNGQVIARLNKLHPWYKAYANPRDVIEARNATNLLLLALCAAEVRASDEAQTWMESLRCDDVSAFLRKSARILQAMLPNVDEEEE